METPVKTPHKVELRAERPIPEAKVWPAVLGGVCEFDGVKYDACEHYKGVQLVCTYCGRSDEDMIRERAIHIYSLSSDPNTLIMCCSDFRCEQAHQQRFARKVLI